MATTDEAVLAYIGRRGKSAEGVAATFPAFDMTRLLRAQLVEVARFPDTEAHVQATLGASVTYVLTRRGAAAIGLFD